MLRLTLALLVAQSSALALQTVHARSAVAVRSAAAMMSDATRDSDADAEAERMAKKQEELRQMSIVQMEKERLLAEHAAILQQHHPKASAMYNT